MRVGMSAGMRVGLGVGTSQTGVEVDVDAGSGKYVPSTGAQFQARGITAPNDIWLCQEASGNLVSHVGTVLTANASPLYQQVIDGWDRVAVGFDGGTNQRFQHATYNNVASSSILVLLYFISGDAPAVAQGVLTAGANFNGAGLSVLATRRLRYRSSASIADSSGTYTGAVTPIFFRHDITNSAGGAFTEAEKLVPSFSSATGTILGLGTGVAALFNVLYMAVWRGAPAQQSNATIKTWMQRLGWSPTWTP